MNIRVRCRVHYVPPATGQIIEPSRNHASPILPVAPCPYKDIYLLRMAKRRARRIRSERIIPVFPEHLGGGLAGIGE